MAESLNNRQQYVAKLPRTDHDISQDFAFTSSTGMLLPVFQQFMNVGETIYATPSMFARSNPLLNAAMADVDVYIDSFFVPMQMLFTAWDSVRWQTNDPISSLWSTVMADKVVFPKFSLRNTIAPNYDSNNRPDVTKQESLTRAQSDLGVDNFVSLTWLPSQFDVHGKECVRLFNHLHMPLGQCFGYRATPEGQPAPYFPNDNDPHALYPYLLAYQCIYQNHYRLDDWERKNVNAYNIDGLYINTSAGANEGMPFAAQLQYRPWHMDYFTSVKNGPLASFVNMVGTSDGIGFDASSILSSINSYLSSSSPFLSDTAGLGVSYLNETTQVGNFGDSSTFVPTAALRSQFALEKLIRIFGRTAKDYDSQVLAHFGFKVPKDVKHNISYLGTSKALLHIGEVISTSDTATDDGGAALGSIAGKGYINLNGKRVKFTAPTDGVFMMIYSAVPRRLYDTTVDKVNMMSQVTDLYIPEYDKLGMQPLYEYERNDLAFSTLRISTRLGWQYRYEQYKRKPNVATIAFRNPNPLRTRTVNMYTSWIVTANDTVSDNTTAFAGYHYCPPTALNDLMVVPYITTWSDDYHFSPWLMFQTDPFINNLHVEAKLISTMSRFGEPNLD